MQNQKSHPHRWAVLPTLCLACVFTGCAAEQTMSPVPSPAVKTETAVRLQAQPFDLRQVRLLDGPFKEAMKLNLQYLHDLDADRLLHTFRINAGLASEARPLGGWENPNGELRGHSIGHFLSGCALAYAQADDAKLKRKGDYVVAELAKCQAALGESGYLSAWPEEFIDRVEARQRVWAPYYTLHKIMAGLVDMYRYGGNGEALEVAKGMARWAESRMSKYSRQEVQAILDATEQGGMNDILRQLYALTGDKSYLATAARFDQDSYNVPLARGEDNLTGQHANSFIPNIVGSARAYELTGEAADRRIAEFFWERVTAHRMYATGGTSDHEHFPEADTLSRAVSSNSHESCCSYNMLKLTQHLFTWEPSARYGDYTERALYNAILPTIDPETAMTMYYVAMRSGLFKTFGTPDNAFWCCTGTGMENHVKYGGMIYYRDAQGLYVNLFIPSELNWKDKGLMLRQETQFPREQTSVLTLALEQSQRLKIRIRKPYWVDGDMGVKVNGKTVKAAAANGYVTLNRRWKDGDRIELDLPMGLHLHRMPDDEHMAAVMYGPLVLAGELGSEGMTEKSVYGHYGHGGEPVPVPALVVTEETASPAEWIVPVDGKPLTWRTANAGKPSDVTLVPFYRLFGQRYAVYWRLTSEAQWQQQQEEARRQARLEKQRQALLIDEVEIGREESEKAHRFKGENFQQGVYSDRHWIHADYPGWISYELKVQAGQPGCLSVTYWGGDSGNRRFTILVDGQKIAEQQLSSLSPGQFVDVKYELPADLVGSKETITVRFEPLEGHVAGGIFGVATLKE